jgi:hypothetical protein
MGAFMARVLLVVCLLLVSQAGFAGEISTLPDSLRTSTTAFAEAMNGRDFARVAEMSHPAVIEAFGGKAAVAAEIRSALQGLNFSDMRFELSGASCAKIAGTKACVVPYSSILTLDGSLYDFESFYIASSSDEGRTWSFADGAGTEEEGTLETLFPGYKGDLVLPSKKLPRLKAVP